MLFSSITFLYYFLPIVLLLYFIIPAKGKNLLLLIASILFYAWGEPKYILLMLASILVGYTFGLILEKNHNRIILFMAVSINLLMLGIFKYADFLIANINKITNGNISFLKLALPIGISFYSFQLISYLTDIYRGDIKAQRNIISFALYLSFFPQLIAGPIVRYKDIEGSLSSRKLSIDNIYLGSRRFIIGLSKKVLLANQLGELCEIFKSSNDKAVLFFWLYALSFTLHIYFDFSGYSDMAIGLGKMFGFNLMENFNYPYISTSIRDFWRRWHISLGRWFRDYLYIPLGGNRVNKLEWFRNILIVWLLTGFWHGASWNFIIWGLYYGIILILEKELGKLIKIRIKFLSHFYLLIIVMIGFVIFNADSIKEIMEYIMAMFAVSNYSLISKSFLYYLKSYGLTIIIAIIAATPLAKYLYHKAGKLGKLFEILAMPILLILVTAYLVDGSFNPFLYFRF